MDNLQHEKNIVYHIPSGPIFHIDSESEVNKSRYIDIANWAEDWKHAKTMGIKRCQHLKSEFLKCYLIFCSCLQA
jgi:hypothetical protein